MIPRNSVGIPLFFMEPPRQRYRSMRTRCLTAGAGGSDDPMAQGEVHEVGIAIDTLGDFERIMDSIRRELFVVLLIVAPSTQELEPPAKTAVTPTLRCKGNMVRVKESACEH